MFARVLISKNLLLHPFHHLLWVTSICGPLQRTQIRMTRRSCNLKTDPRNLRAKVQHRSLMERTNGSSCHMFHRSNLTLRSRRLPRDVEAREPCEGFEKVVVEPLMRPVPASEVRQGKRQQPWDLLQYQTRNLNVVELKGNQKPSVPRQCQTIHVEPPVSIRPLLGIDNLWRESTLNETDLIVTGPLRPSHLESTTLETPRKQRGITLDLDKIQNLSGKASLI